MNKIIVTGNAGFIGSYVQDELINLGYQVYGIDDLSGGFKCNVNDKLKEFHRVDLSTEHKKIDYIVQQIKPDTLVHVAASAHEGGSFFDPVRIGKNNFMAYMNILESCIKTGSLKMVTCFGSMAQYGEGIPPFKENDILEACDPYAVNKNAMEKITKQLAKCFGFKYSWIVPHNVIGIRQALNDKFRNFATIIMNRIMRNEPLFIYGDGEQKRQFSYIKDSLPCFIQMINEKYNGERVNIGGIKEITVNNLLQLIIDNFKDDFKIPNIVHLPERHGEVKYAYCCPDKSISLLGYKESYTIEEAIGEISEWAKKMGRREWRKDKLAIFSDKWPLPWKTHYTNKLI